MKIVMQWRQLISIMKVALFFLSTFILLGSCELQPNYEVVEAPQEIREKAYTIAQFYIGMEYEWGGQTHWSSKGVDCSGLIVNAFKEALAGTPYKLPYDDAAVVNLLNSHTVPVQEPKKGDLVFMGVEEITHVALLEKIENNTVYFIDAYSNSGVVEYRSYALTNEKIKQIMRHVVWY